MSTDFRIKFDATFKDGVHCSATLPIDADVFKVLRTFHQGKAADARIFEVDSRDVNSFLAKSLPDLSAKVFRTFYASQKLDSKLAEIDENLTKDEKVSKC